jgi:hypothetical protein
MNRAANRAANNHKFIDVPIAQVGICHAEIVYVVQGIISAVIAIRLAFLATKNAQPLTTAAERPAAAHHKVVHNENTDTRYQIGKIADPACQAGGAPRGDNDQKNIGADRFFSGVAKGFEICASPCHELRL